MKETGFFRNNFMAAAVTILLSGVLLILAGCAGKSDGSADVSGRQSGFYQFWMGTDNAISTVPFQDFGTVRILTASDLHYLSPALTDHGEYFEQMIRNADGKTMEYSGELVDAFVDTVISEQPDALVLTGDLTFNGARKSHEDLAAKLRKITDAGIPVLVLSGNHDLNNADAAAFHGDSFTRVENISAEEFDDIYREDGFSRAISKDENSSSYVYELKPGLRLLMLDVNGVEQMCHVPDGTLQWLEQELRAARKAGCRVLSFSHQNLLQHSLFVSGYVIDNSDAVLELFEKYSVPINFSGHLHIQHIADQDGFFEVATSALSIAPEHYGMIDVTSEMMQYETKSVDVSSWIKDNNDSNPDLRDFQTYAEQFFLKSSRKSAQRELAGMEDGTSKNRMVDYFARRNYAYFSGTAWEEQKSDRETLKDWEDSGTFAGEYLKSLAESKPIDENHLVLHFQ